MNKLKAIGHRILRLFSITDLFEQFSEVIATISRNKLRTTLTGMAVSVGIFLLIFLLGAGNGIIHAFESTSSRFALDVVNVSGGYTSKPYAGFKEGREIKLDTRDMDISNPSINANISELAATLSQDSIIIYSNKANITATFKGVFPSYEDMDKVQLISGRFINELDLKQRRRSVILNEKDAKELFNTTDNLEGKYVRANQSDYIIVGISKDNNDQGTALIPFTTLQTIFKKGINIDQLKIKTSGLVTDEENEGFETNVTHALSINHKFAPDDKRALWIFNTTTGAKESNTAMRILRTAIWVIGLLTLLSGVVGISNIMLISVKERTHEFGILKALGARPWSILKSVILESILITLFFGYIGLVLGVLGTEYLNYTSGKEAVTIAGNTFVTFLNPTVDMGIAIRALLTLVIAGIVAGYIPARKAVRVKPVEALRK